MNFLLVPCAVLLGFAVSRALLEVLPPIRQPHPGPGLSAITPYALMLAMLTGPALFAVNAWRMRDAAPSTPAHLLVSGCVAFAWAGLHGLVILDLAGLTVLVPG